MTDITRRRFIGAIAAGITSVAMATRLGETKIVPLEPPIDDILMKSDLWDASGDSFTICNNLITPHGYHITIRTADRYG